MQSILGLGLGIFMGSILVWINEEMAKARMRRSIRTLDAQIKRDWSNRYAVVSI